ncbi:uncharacterized protein LOC127711981 [Mytilus californianus]|uniref:uncharacterized protein LOC127711981 n=1 Tax=Mytilus californianus TaxID=6549 RepID=UPI0022469B88|nr:uncharacterized protein LOC127711981 [Mytilus californianus]
MSMRFQHHWMSAIDFDYHIQEFNSSSIIERVWLEPVVTSSLKKQMHVLLSANLGYGKSTIVSQIMCAGVYSPWHHLRQMVNAYHMCRFNYKASIQSDIFIRNLAGKIVKDVPELGNAILADEHALDYLEEYRCKQDPFLCLEIAIIAPMKHIQTERKYLIIIDALDECDTPIGNDLYDLLAKKISDFPPFFQFLFTSRKISKILYEFKTLQNVREIDLESFEERNILDAHRLIEITSNLTDEKKLQLVNLSNGNLLHINSYLDYCRRNISCEFSKVPKTLENIYHFNLERILGTNGTSFEEWNALFEVLCASANPIYLDDLFLIAGLDDNKRRTFSILLGNEFGHFLKHYDNKLSFQHKSFKEFLTNESRKLLSFYINITKGHTLFTKHLLHKPTSQKLLNEKALLDIASHVALTYNIQFAKTFLKLFNRTHLEHYSLLIYMAREINCYDTANLVIQLIIQSGLSSSNMSNAAFIASSNGNFKTLISFDENKVNFKSKYNLVLEHSMKGADLVYMCKFVFFCGYNVFHIAAQRGYVEIVDYLLNKYPDILYEQNSIHLNAFQLAAENGHTKLVKLFLDIDSSLADQHSLYYASQQGHDEIVSLLLNYVDETCLPCNGTLYWLPTLSFRKQNNVTIQIEALGKNSNYFQNLDLSQLGKMLHDTEHAVLLDDWRLITCESALNAAVRNGHLRIVKSLLEEEVNTLHCEMFDGSTPLMTAAMYDQTEVFRYLHDSGGNFAFRCKRKFLYEDKIEKPEMDLLKERTCPESGSISHLLAIHNSYGIIKYLLKKGFEDWETRDSKGLTPAHYAFCCNSNNFIKFVVFADKDKVHLNLNSKSANGSTPYHSAAICKSLILTHYVDTSVRTLPDKVDNNNRSILHYGLMQTVSQEDAIQIDRVGKDYFSDLLLRVTLNNKHDYLRVDDDGRNVLHYAASSGNYWVFLKVLQVLKKGDINVMLYCKDKRGYTPLKAAFDSLTPRQAFESLKMPLNCSLNELFSTTCKANLSVILLPHEYFIFTVSKYLSSSNYFTPLNVKDYLTLAINKSRIYPILILKSYTPNEFNAIVSTSTEIPTLLAKSDIQIIVEHIFNVDNSLRCNKSESPLHQLVLNAMNGQDILPLTSFLIHLFKKFSSRYLDQCYDKDGYNLLHRATMGGNIGTVKLMLKKGMNVSCLSKNGRSVLELCIYSSPFLKNGHVPSYYVSGPRFHVLEYVFQSETFNISFDRTQTIDFDTTSDLLLNKTAESLMKNKLQKDICDRKNIGLLHVAAAKGLLKFIKRVHSIFGTQSIRCRDRFNVSSYYLALIYGQTDIVRWIKTLQMKYKPPAQIVQNILIYNLISNYLTLSRYDWTCFQDYNFKYRALLRNQAVKCISRVPSERIHYINMHNVSTIETWFTSIYFDFMESNAVDKDSEIVNMMDIFQRIHKKNKAFGQLYSLYHLSQFSNFIRRQLLLFNIDDGEYFYRYLQTRGMQTKEPLSDYEINELYQAVISRNYQHFQKLQVRKDLHKEWFHVLITDKNETSFLRFHEFVVKRIEMNMKRFENIVRDGKLRFLERVKAMDVALPMNQDEACFLIFQSLQNILSEDDNLWQSQLQILFRDLTQEDVVFYVERLFKTVVFRGDNMFTKKAKGFNLSIDKALQNTKLNKKDYLFRSFKFVLIETRKLYSKYFEKGVDLTVVL